MCYRHQARELAAARKESVALTARIADADVAFQAQLQAARDAAAADRAAAEAEVHTLRRMTELKVQGLLDSVVSISSRENPCGRLPLQCVLQLLVCIGRVKGRSCTLCRSNDVESSDLPVNAGA